ncbi:cytochrome P450 [Penicillium concentricum]|uniref:Cytochrome P450 n=1 Tax=Penicillium concentricum TaxID=293559 RepID=A0A9W9VBA7_9EURO|nr:cytochrome P450 [Penicillium concentricum]KAJ5373106.1 cytochrome P450 [Penicillium concentricum]
MTPLLASLALGAFLSVLYLGYRWILPRPIPGIPYNREATNNVLGDLPALIEHGKKTGEKLSWLPLQAKKLNSPIIQIFANPLTKPWVILTEFRESQDILLRRTKEFDRSDHFGNIFRGLTPDHHISMKTTNPQFKAHRRLIQDLMTPAFLNEVSAPRIYEAFTSLVNVWTEKARLANGHPFSASEDFYKAALDAIWAVTFPLDPKDSVINAQRQLLTETASINTTSSTNIDEPAVFPEAPIPDAPNSILTLTESLEPVVLSPIPKLTFWFMSQLPYMRRARAAKETMIATELEKAKARFSSGTKEEHVARCAMDDILRRELAAAKKENREPSYNTRTIFDELFGLLIAGHDTTSTTATWGLKLLSDHQEIQKKLREALRSGFPAAIAERRQPTAEEISKARITYLDATQEEIIRKSMTASGVTRTAMVDTVVLGHHIPKGTNVFLMGNGPDFIEPPIGKIPEDRRSKSCQEANGRIGSWDPADSNIFKPERWITKEDGKESFDSTSGPLLTFGLGPRGCFGRRMAYLELKIVLVLLLWNFELQSVPGTLSSYQAVDKLTHQPRQCYLRLLSSSLNDPGA